MTYVSRRRWTPDEDREIWRAVDNFRQSGRAVTTASRFHNFRFNFSGAETMEELARRLGRSPDAVAKRAVRIGARRYRPRSGLIRGRPAERPPTSPSSPRLRRWKRPRIATPWILGWIRADVLQAAGILEALEEADRRRMSR